MYGNINIWNIRTRITPVSRKSTVEQLKPKQKNQLKLRNNQTKTGNVLIIGSSITKDINTKTLKENVTVNTNRGGTTGDRCVRKKKNTI